MRGHKIHLISFFNGSIDLHSDLAKQLGGYCESIQFFEIPNDPKRLVKNVISSLCTTDVITFRFKSQNYSDSLINTLRNYNIDLVHIDLVSLTHYIKSIDRLVPSVASINDSYSLWLKEKLLKPPNFTLKSIQEKLYHTLVYPFATVYEKNIYKQFQKVHVVSRIDEVYLSALNCEIDLEVIPNGVDTKYFKPLNLLPNRLSLVFVAYMGGENSYNILWFIKKIFRKVRERVPDVTLFVVGKDPLPILILEGNRTKGVVVTGYVRDVRPYIDKATIIIDPTVKSCGIFNHVLQSMAMGKAVVGTTSSFLAINGAKSWKNVVVSNNETDFISNIIYLLENENARKNIGKNARSLIEMNYQWANIITQYELMYEHAIKKFEKCA